MNAHVILDYPSNNVSFSSGESIQIQWHVLIEHEQHNWDLYLSTDNGQNWLPIILDLPVSQNSFEWIVPEVNTVSVMIKVIQDNVGTDYEDISPVFKINSYTAIHESKSADKRNFFYLSKNGGRVIFHINLVTERYINLEIYDLNGRYLMSIVNTRLLPGHSQFESDEFKPGLYIYHINDGNYQTAGLFYNVD